MSRDAGPLRVAIVGVGPKGLYSLERLVDHAAGRPDVPVTIDLFEPHPSPGAGPVYDPAQPPYLRLNFPADRIDLWSPRPRFLPAEAQQSFCGWRAGKGQAGNERFPSRAEVGAYLHAGFRLVLDHAPAHVRILLHPRRVIAVERAGDRWRVTGADGRSEDGFDEVLVSVGHQERIVGRLADDWCHAARLVPAVFPVDRWFGEERIAPGAVVAARGFALTWIDAVLSLFEGRGGQFVPTGHPYRLRYVPSGREAALVIPFSRTGRPMLAKPEVAMSGPVGALVIAEGIERLESGRSGDPRELGECVAQTAARLLAAARGSAREDATGSLARATSGWLLTLTDPARLAPAPDPAAEIERSVAVAVGARPPDIRWALGETWRRLYPTIVAELGHGGLDRASWPGFRRLADEMERLAFGPPAPNAAKIFCLIDAGRIDLRFAAAPRLESQRGRTSIVSANARRQVDVVVDSVLAPPGAAGLASPLLRGLIESGAARVGAGRRGLEVTRSAQCVGRLGHPTPGLSAIGRPTEDWVIGNDTLDRQLHPDAELWAERLAARATRGAAGKERERVSGPR